MHVTFTADGSFSVGNPVHVKVDMYNVSNSQAISDSNTSKNTYCCATLTNALNIPPLQGTGTAARIVLSDRIHLTDYHNGSYIGSADIMFNQPGNQNISLLPPANLTNPVPILDKPPSASATPYNIPSQSVISVSDSTATAGFDSTDFVVRITLLIGAFSVVLLQPVLEAILVPERPREIRPEQSPPQQQSSPHLPPPTLSLGERKRWEKRHPKSQQEKEKQNPPTIRRRERVNLSSDSPRRSPPETDTGLKHRSARQHRARLQHL